MRKYLILSLLVAAVGGGFAAAHGDYSALAREMQIQRTPSAEILKQHAMHQASVERALEQPALSAHSERHNAPVAYYFKANISS